MSKPKRLNKEFGKFHEQRRELFRLEREFGILIKEISEEYIAIYTSRSCGIGAQYQGSVQKLDDESYLTLALEEEDEVEHKDLRTAVVYTLAKYRF